MCLMHFFLCCRGDADGEQQRPHAPAGPPLVQYDLEQLEEAGRLLSAEVDVVRAAMGHSDVPLQEYYKAWQDTSDEFVLDEQVCCFLALGNSNSTATKE